jgi:hypothetical protein
MEKDETRIQYNVDCNKSNEYFFRDSMDLSYGVDDCLFISAHAKINCSNAKIILSRKQIVTLMLFLSIFAFLQCIELRLNVAFMLLIYCIILFKFSILVVISFRPIKKLI